jgi:streptomycin 3"-adenylyltransferase
MATRRAGLLDPTPEVLRLIGEVLGAGVIGAYAHGSAVLGRLQPLSDVDVLVVIRRRTTHAERRALVDGLLGISGPWPPVDRRPVELTVVVQSDVRPWRYPPVMDLQFGEWLRAELERGRPLDPPAPTPDLAPVLTMVVAGNHPLVGPPPAEVLDPVPPDDLRRAMHDVVPGLLLDLEGDTRNVILTLARIWTTLVTGELCSKDAAADWALARLPDEHRAVLQHARAVYLGEADEDWSELGTRVGPHVEHVLRQVVDRPPAGQ